MVNKLESKAGLARRLGLSRAALTKVSKSWPDEAFVGTKIDLAHHTVVEYVKEHAAGKTQEPTKPAAMGLDPLWEHALAYCYESGDWTITGLKVRLNVGHSRAKRIIEAFKASELLPSMRRHAPPGVPAQPRVLKTPKSDPLAAGVPRISNDSEGLDCIDAELPEDLREFRGWTLEQLLMRFGTHTGFKEWLRSVKEMEAIEEKRLKNDQTRGNLVDKELIGRVLDIFDTQHMRLLSDGAKSITADVVGKHQAGVLIEDIETYVSNRIGTFITAAKNKVARLEKTGRRY